MNKVSAFGVYDIELIATGIRINPQGYIGVNRWFEITETCSGCDVKKEGICSGFTRLMENAQINTLNAEILRGSGCGIENRI